MGLKKLDRQLFLYVQKTKAIYQKILYIYYMNRTIVVLRLMFGCFINSFIRI